jgi:hypothetical protein
MAKARRARPLIDVCLREEYCPKSRFSDSPGELKRQCLEVTYSEKDPVRGWTHSSFEYNHNRELIWGNRFDDLAEGIVHLLGGDQADFKASTLLSGVGSGNPCSCGHMHTVVTRAWRLAWSKRRYGMLLALHGKSDTDEQWKRRRETLIPIWDELRKHQARCADQDRDEEDRRAAFASVQPVTVQATP